MADETNTTPGNPPVPPAILSGDELYDSIMGQIEPELLSANLPLIPSLCANENPEQKSVRAKRYQAAFDEYDRQFAKHCQAWDEQLHNYKRDAVHFIEHEAQADEVSQLEQIESSINE